MLTQLWAYVQAHPATALGIAGFAVIVGVLLYDNWGKLKLPSIGGGLTRVQVIQQLDQQMAWFASVGCNEGIEATEKAMEHACHYHPPKVVTVTPPDVVPSSATQTLTVTGQSLSASQAP